MKRKEKQNTDKRCKEGKEGTRKRKTEEHEEGQHMKRKTREKKINNKQTNK